MRASFDKAHALISFIENAFDGNSIASSNSWLFLLSDPANQRQLLQEYITLIVFPSWTPRPIVSDRARYRGLVLATYPTPLRAGKSANLLLRSSPLDAVDDLERARRFSSVFSADMEGHRGSKAHLAVLSGIFATGGSLLGKLAGAVDATSLVSWRQIQISSKK